MEASDTSNIDWNDVIKKEARGGGNEDLGEVQEVDQNYVLVQRGILNKEKFYIPKELAESYDGNVLRFRISEDEAKNRFLTHSPSKSSTDEKPVPRKNNDSMIKRAEDDERVPITEERIDVQKTTSVGEATIVKEPVTKTKTFEVPLTHEEISVERRPVSSNNTTTTERPVESKTEIKIPLKREGVEVKKQPYVKEEVALRKKPVTESRKVREEITSEKVNSSESTGADIREEEL